METKATIKYTSHNRPSVEYDRAKTKIQGAQDADSAFSSALEQYFERPDNKFDPITLNQIKQTDAEKFAKVIKSLIKIYSGDKYETYERDNVSYGTIYNDRIIKKVSKEQMVSLLNDLHTKIAVDTPDPTDEETEEVYFAYVSPNRSLYRSGEPPSGKAKSYLPIGADWQELMRKNAALRAKNKRKK